MDEAISDLGLHALLFDLSKRPLANCVGSLSDGLYGSSCWDFILKFRRRMIVDLEKWSVFTKENATSLSASGVMFERPNIRSVVMRIESYFHVTVHSGITCEHACGTRNIVRADYCCNKRMLCKTAT